MKRAFFYIAMGLALTACADGLRPTGPDGHGLGLTFFVADKVATKMDVTQVTDGIAGEEDMNENLLRTLDIFFYPVVSSGAEDEAPTYHLFVSGSEQTEWTVSEVTEQSVLKQIFGDPLVPDTQREVYVVANYYDLSGETPVAKLTGNESRKTIRSLTVLEADFSKASSGAGVKEASFVMEGQTIISLVKRSGYYFVNGEVPMYRAAAKARLEVTIPQDVITNGVVDGNGFTWHPLKDQMEVIIVNGVNKGIVCAMNDDYNYTVQAADIYPASIDFPTYGHKMATTGTKMDGSVEVGPMYEHDVPFYSYPTPDWKTDSDKECYLILMMPWQREDLAANVPTYYQIPMAVNPTDPEYKLKHNRYYRMEVEVSIIGSFTLDDKVTLKPNSYIILGWRSNIDSDPTVSNVSMSHTAYLSVASNSVDMPNVASGSVEYASSHDVTAEFTKLEFYSYYDTNTTDRYLRVVYTRQKNSSGAWTNTWSRIVYNGETGAEITSNGYNSNNAGNPFTTNTTYKGFPLGGYSLTTDDGEVTLTHDIPSSQFVMAKITVELTNSAITTPEVITFTQTPAIYITGHQSNGYVFINGYGYNTRYNHYSYDDRGFASNNYYLGVIRSSNEVTGGSGGNNNRNLYTIHISSFSDSDNYVIGDPRTSTTISLSNLSGTNNKYHATTSNYPNNSPLNASAPHDDTENMISPEFMVASSFGRLATPYLTYEQAQKRCAAYQEDGYPAGRWRMPTKAEVMYIMELSAAGKIPSLFNLSNNDNTGYWCANGKIQGNSSGYPYLGTNTSNTAVRCVYDIWYWGSEPYNGTHSITWQDYQY